MPYNLRSLFVTILVYCHRTNLNELWEEFKEKTCEDFYRELHNRSMVERRAMQYIHSILESLSKDIRTYNLNCPSIEEKQDVTVVLMLQSSLNDKQKLAYDLIIGKVFKDESRMFFIDGPGAPGKLFCIEQY
ncbi:hypothetical protein Syun_007293 [Stephania yunnanensis]|uniref:ATP-dependent DNA helicase n=1 Tax=Stephania yunnanensis TaxID=152371 RepID=A0AAP0KZY5_9MAGN